MGHKTILSIVFLAIVALFLVIIFCLSGQWILAFASLAPTGAMFIGRRRSSALLAHISLVGFTVLAAVGIMLGHGLLLMAIVVTVALASWDLTLEALARLPTTRTYDRQHGKYLAAALGLALIVIGFGQSLHWRFPFVGMLVLVVLLLFTLNQVYNDLANDKH